MAVTFALNGRGGAQCRLRRIFLALSVFEAHGGSRARCDGTPQCSLVVALDRIRKKEFDPSQTAALARNYICAARLQPSIQSGRPGVAPETHATATDSAPSVAARLPYLQSSVCPCSWVPNPRTARARRARNRARMRRRRLQTQKRYESPRHSSRGIAAQSWTRADKLARFSAMARSASSSTSRCRAAWWWVSTFR